MPNIQLNDDLCHLYVEQNNQNKLIIEVSFDISDFTEQEVYDYFGEKIYGNGREHLNDIFEGTKMFGSGLTSFNDYLKGYLGQIDLNNRSEFLSIIMTNHKNIPVSDFWVSFLNVLMCKFFYSYTNMNYCNFFDMKISKSIMNSSMDHFAYLLCNYEPKAQDLLDQDYV